MPPSTSSPSSSGRGRSRGSGIRWRVRRSRMPPQPHAHPMPPRPHVVPTLVPLATEARFAPSRRSSPPLRRLSCCSSPTLAVAPGSTTSSWFDRLPTPHPRLCLTSVCPYPLLPAPSTSAPPPPLLHGQRGEREWSRRWPTHPPLAASLASGGLPSRQMKEEAGQRG